MISDEEIVYGVQHKPGVVICNELVSVIDRSNNITEKQLLRFVLFPERNENNGFLNAYIIDSDGKKVHKNIFLFSSIEEFFVLKDYLTRNGITKL